MWLLNASTLQLEEFYSENVPKYAILSHAWGPEEVSFQDITEGLEKAKRKTGFSKIQNFCEQAVRDKFEYAWCDTCCIDKRSSAELSEAINSMYEWYAQAQICYVYLSDVLPGGLDPSPENLGDAFSKSRWFTRGWTLQELIAPSRVIFLAQDWSLLGQKLRHDDDVRTEKDKVFMSKLSRITGIREVVLGDSTHLRRICIAHRMAWAARRTTTRSEDMSYCLLGLFGISMPILYGEGSRKAFKRLQIEILNSSADESIFAWRADRKESGLLATGPEDFAESLELGLIIEDEDGMRPWSMTNIGLAINLPLLDGNVGSRSGLACLKCLMRNSNGKISRVCLYVVHWHSPNEHFYRRVHCDKFELIQEGADPRRLIGQRGDIIVVEDDRIHDYTFQILAYDK